MSAKSLKSTHLAVTYRSIGSLSPDPGNARTHPKAQIDQIAASIRVFGFTNPILVDSDKRIIAGHGRLLAARALGLKEVPTIELGNLSDIQKRALRIADNKIALGAGWDLDLLKIELSEIEVEMDLSITGFSTGELDVKLNGKADADADFVPPLPTTPRTRSGDIWLAGRASYRLRRCEGLTVPSRSHGAGHPRRRRLPGSSLQRHR